MLRKDEMAVRLAQAQWMIDMHLEQCDKATKADITGYLRMARDNIRAIADDYRKPRPRKTAAEVAAEKAEAQRAEAEANGQTTVEEAISEHSDSNS